VAGLSSALAACHDLGHDGDATACFEQGRDCLDLCEAAATDAGIHMDGGAHHTDGGAHHTDGGDSCEGLGRNCHPVDPGSGPLHDCHEVGHGSDQLACSAQRAGCIAGCGAALCTLIGSTCHAVAGLSSALAACHDLGHDGDATACFEQGRDCLDLCEAAATDAGIQSDGSVHHADGSAHADAQPD
jgi:hypothetical protein